MDLPRVREYSSEMESLHAVDVEADDAASEAFFAPLPLEAPCDRVPATAPAATRSATAAVASGLVLWYHGF